MLLYPITPTNNKIYNRSFQGKNIDVERIFSSQKFKEELSKIQTNKDAKNIFLGLSVLAGTVLAELAAFADKAPEIKNFADKILNNLKIKEDDNLKKEMSELFSSILDNNTEVDDVSALIEEKPARKEYLDALTEYPNLNNRYRQMLERAAKEPDNAKNKFTMETLEVAFNMMIKGDRLQYYEAYLNMLDKKYSDRLDDIATNIISAYKNGDTPLTYMQMLYSTKWEPKYVSLWAKAKNLTSSEFYKCKFLDEERLVNLSELRAKNNNFKISMMRPFDNYKIPMYTFRLHFKDGISLEDKFKAITDVHTALYGPISLNDESDIIAHYMNSDIRTELADNILKDRRVNSVFRFVRYLNPEAVSDIKLTSKEIKFLSKEDEEYKKIKDICSKEVMNLDAENPRLFEIYELLQNEDIFGNIFKTTHARLRFLTRFVLNSSTTPQNIIYKCNSKLETLKKEIDANLSNYNILCYSNKRGFAPQFYHYNSKIGNHIKITLNSSGNIHTIYEDAYKEQKDKEIAELKKDGSA